MPFIIKAEGGGEIAYIGEHGYDREPERVRAFDTAEQAVARIERLREIARECKNAKVRRLAAHIHYEVTQV